MNNEMHFHKHLAEAADWLCECGERCSPAAPGWRWNGRTWEHYHGYPIGHVEAAHSPVNGEAKP